MASQDFSDTYRTYKRFTNSLVGWLVQNSNTVLAKKPAPAHTFGQQINTTCHVSVSDIVPMANLIAGNVQNIPSVVFRLLQTAIELRLSCNLQFERLAVATSDEEMMASNRSHKHFIKVLRETFKILGGNKWEQEQEAANVLGDTNAVSTTKIMANMFSLLNLQAADGSDSCSEAEESHLSTKQRKRAKKANKKKKHREVNVEDYKILDDGMDKLQAEYVLAATNISEQVIDLRLQVQKLWADVAYQSTWPLCAAGASFQAAEIVKQAQVAIFHNFPDDDSYIKLVREYTGGGIEKLPERTTIRASAENDGGDVDVPYELREHIVSREHMKELLMLNTYHDLIEFVRDYNQAPVGEPTEALNVRLIKWEFDTDVAKLSPKNLKAWRRLYTIKWLYTLLKSFYEHDKLVQERALILSNGDQAPSATRKTSFFLMNDFVADLINLISQGIGVAEEKISFHLLFQLQCMVDSFTVSRGWRVRISSNVMQDPAYSLADSTTAKYIEQLLCSGNEAEPRGVVSAVNYFSTLKEDEKPTGSFGLWFMPRIKLDIASQYGVLSNWMGFLAGERKDIDLGGLKVNSQEVWALCPLMCGSTLIEAVKRNFGYAMMV